MNSLSHPRDPSSVGPLDLQEVEPPSQLATASDSQRSRLFPGSRESRRQVPSKAEARIRDGGGDCALAAPTTLAVAKAQSVRSAMRCTRHN